MTSILQDVRFALRRLWEDRSFAVAAMAALVLGIGANSAVFTIVNGVLLRSLPFDDPDRIVRMDTRDAQGRERGTSLTISTTGSAPAARLLGWRSPTVRG